MFYSFYPCCEHTTLKRLLCTMRQCLFSKEVYQTEEIFCSKDATLSDLWHIQACLLILGQSKHTEAIQSYDNIKNMELEKCLQYKNFVLVLIIFSNFVHSCTLASRSPLAEWPCNKTRSWQQLHSQTRLRRKAKWEKDFLIKVDQLVEGFSLF